MASEPLGIDSVRKFAALTRGEIGNGDQIYNADSFAFRIGLQNQEAAELVQSLKMSEREYSLLTGLPPTSLQRMANEIKAGIREAKRSKIHG